MVSSSAGCSSRVVSGTPSERARASVSSDVGTPTTSLSFPSPSSAASRCTTSAEVLPEPSPTRIPGWMSSTARSAAIRL